MPSLPDELFSILENKTLKAREAAEKAARNITAYLKVESGAWWGEKDDPQRRLWLGLRARARQLGYTVEENGEKDPIKRGLPQLIEEIGYVQWHRMLFARFLAENQLLMHPSGVAVSLAECEELAPEEGEDDAWRLAARYASAMLPGIFKQEDPCAQVRLTPSDHHALESTLLEIPAPVFTCDDALGWMYQFWQSKKKEEVNDSGRKIGGADLSPVTQLFTEDYMVRFLLENSLGAWWAARHPESRLIKEWEYLRFKEDGTPAAGAFPEWPEHTAEVTVMDPCCGSGHFLVAAFDMLRKMRMEEEGIGAGEAGNAVLRDNIFGLEIDLRCTQIAAFALALMTWKSGSYRCLPELNIACCGVPVEGQLKDWQDLAGKDGNMRIALEQLHSVFTKSQILGSLIDPSDMNGNGELFAPEFERLAPLLEKALVQEEMRDSDAHLSGVSAQGVAKAAKLMAGKYKLVVTNVPYLGQKKQIETLGEFCQNKYPDGRADLATVFLERCKDFSSECGTYAIVTPQNWLFQTSSIDLRVKILKNQTWHLVARLNEGAFFSSAAAGAFPALIILSNVRSNAENTFAGIDVSKPKTPYDKSLALKKDNFGVYSQKAQLLNPGSRIAFTLIQTKSLLSDYVYSSSGMLTSDRNRFICYFWEIKKITPDWEFSQGSVTKIMFYGGREEIVYYQGGKGDLFRLAQSLRHLNHAVQNWQRGQIAWGKLGVAVTLMRKLPCSIYTGELFDNTIAVLYPKEPKHLIALWAFCSSSEYETIVRKYNQKISVDPGYLIGIPFDLEHWQKEADRLYPNGLPSPQSNDPTQWLFLGLPKESTAPLQVSLARLLGYQWPQQTDNTLNNFIDTDGIVCLIAVNGEPPAAERLRGLLSAAYGSEWSGAKQEELLAEVGYSGKELTDWLRDGFFEQHCKLFQNRPFIWHIWDGRKDGFSALVNYHKLDRANLEKLTYTSLGAWIFERRKELERGAAGAEGRLIAAQALQDKLKLILAGEPPYDIYVRWKPLHEQPMGWEPDLNDGVRLNIRPFIAAGVLRSKFTINWNKDRGKNPDGSERLNDLHFTVAEKQAARAKQRQPES